MKWIFVESKATSGIVSWLNFLVEYMDHRLSMNTFSSLIFYCECGPLIDKWNIELDCTVPAVPEEMLESELKLSTSPITIPVSESHYTIIMKISEEAYFKSVLAEELIGVFFQKAARAALSRFMMSNEALHAANPDYPEDTYKLDIESVFPYYQMWNKIGIL